MIINGPWEQSETCWHPRGRGVGVGITAAVRRNVDRRSSCDRPAEAGTHVGVGVSSRNPLWPSRRARAVNRPKPRTAASLARRARPKIAGGRRRKGYSVRRKAIMSAFSWRVKPMPKRVS